MVFSSLEQALGLFPLIMGMYFSYHILRLTDLTVDGSFVLGAALYGRLLTSGCGYTCALGGALMGGALAGLFVATIQRHDRMDALLASIVTLLMLYSINFQVMGKPNLNLMQFDLFASFFGPHKTSGQFLTLVGVACLLMGGLVFILNLPLGTVFRAFGANKNLLQRYHQNPEVYRAVGLALSNGLAAFCGVVYATVNGYADMNMGVGIALTGIGAVVMGKHFMTLLKKILPILHTVSTLVDLVGCFLGLLVYFLLINGLLVLDINPINLKFFLGALLIGALGMKIKGERKCHA